MSQRIPMTSDGLTTLEEELRQLRNTARPEVIRAIAQAREHGDLSENAEYHAARDRQSFIEGRVGELEDKISRAEVIDVSKLSGQIVKFGAKVSLIDACAGGNCGMWQFVTKKMRVAPDDARSALGQIQSFPQPPALAASTANKSPRPGRLVCTELRERAHRAGTSAARPLGQIP